MNAARHQFVEPWTPAYVITDVAEIDAEQNELSRLREWARSIVADARKALPCEVSALELADWAEASQRFLDGDAEDLRFLAEELDALINPLGYGMPDEDAGWRQSHAAETHFGGRHFA